MRPCLHALQAEENVFYTLLPGHSKTRNIQSRCNYSRNNPLCQDPIRFFLQISHFWVHRRFVTETSRKTEKTERRNWKRPDRYFCWMRKKSFNWTWWTWWTWWTTWTTLLFRVHFVHLVHWVHLKICQAAGNFKREINKSFCHKPSKNQKMVGGGGDRREACVSIGARRGGEKRKATQSKITAAPCWGTQKAKKIKRQRKFHLQAAFLLFLRWFLKPSFSQ